MSGITHPWDQEPQVEEQPVTGAVPSGERQECSAAQEDLPTPEVDRLEVLVDQLSAGTHTGPRHARQVRWVTLPESLKSAYFAVGARAVRGLLLIAVVILGTLGLRTWWVYQGASAQEIGEIVGTVGATITSPTDLQASDTFEADQKSVAEGHEADSLQGMGSEMPSTGSAPALPTDAQEEQPGASGTPAPMLWIHVSGAVQDPGVVRLHPQARVIDAIDAAGGFTDEADPSSLNLARLLVDGEQLWVGSPGQAAPSQIGQPALPSVGVNPDHSPVDGTRGSPVNLNTASAAELEALPGIGPVTAAEILNWRQQHGAFNSIEELMEVSGIGERTFARLEPLVAVGP